MTAQSDIQSAIEHLKIVGCFCRGRWPMLDYLVGMALLEAFEEESRVASARPKTSFKAGPARARPGKPQAPDAPKQRRLIKAAGL